MNKKKSKENNLIDNSKIINMQSFSHLFYVLILLSCNDKTVNNSQSELGSGLDSLFIQWNKATLGSLDARVRLSLDSAEYILYMNRSEVFKGYLEIENENELNAQSLRYQFLQILEDYNNEKGYYIVEANRSGERIELRNFVIPIGDQSQVVNIDRYVYYNQGWKKMTSYQKASVQIGKNLDRYFERYGLGFNHDDVIITKIVNNKVVESEYFLNTVLSGSIGLKEILE